ncbi:MAG: MCE family protein [Planctomycetes bacterium]|nr:MCE family protein [Planctomycetota bacterium]
MERIRYLVGSVTLVATIVAAVFLYGWVTARGNAEDLRVRVEFRDARGLRPGAEVRYRGVVVGAVREVALSADGRKAVAMLSIASEHARDARQRSRFWIVVPRLGSFPAGVTGLETLVRDAYIAFASPEDAGPPLGADRLVVGAEAPWSDDGARDAAPLQAGDLGMTVLVARSHGLVPGSEVRFRGIVVGDVRRLELAEDGSHVRVELRIHRRYRKTVTDRSRFWQARPKLSGALVGGFSVEDLGALLSPYVAYSTPLGEGLPVEDGYVVLAEVERPDLEEDLPSDTVARSNALRDAAEWATDIRVVEIAYEAEEVDWFNANDRVRRESQGLLYHLPDGRRVVLTARSACDGNYIFEDMFGDPDIGSEAIRVTLPEVGVLRAERLWIAPDELDLALLVVPDAPADVIVTPPARIAFDGAAPAELIRPGEDHPARLIDVVPTLADSRGAALLREGRVVAILGQTSRERLEPAPVPLSILPAELRPVP